MLFLDVHRESMHVGIEREFLRDTPNVMVKSFDIQAYTSNVKNTRSKANILFVLQYWSNYNINALSHSVHMCFLLTINCFLIAL